MILSDCRKKLNSDYLRDNYKCSRHKTDSETGGKVTYAGVQSNQAKRLEHQTGDQEGQVFKHSQVTQV